MTSPVARTILITGGTSGIGRALVARYHADGWHVLTCARSIAALNQLQTQFSGITTIPCDLADSGERRALLRYVQERINGLDGLINNAGVQMSYGFASGAWHAAALDTEVAANFIAPVDLGHLFAPLLVSRTGFIANITSGLAYVPKGRSPVYAATKAALALYTRSVRYQRPEVRFVEVVMPMVDTPMTAGRGRGKLTPSEAARQTQEGIAAGQSTIWVGKARFIPLINRFFPGIFARLMNSGDAGDVPSGPSRPS